MRKGIILLAISLLFSVTQVVASVRCSDEVFLRRVYLTVTGALPTPQQAVEFIQDQSSDKREVLIDKLLQRVLGLKYLQMRWGDLLRIKSEFPSNLWPNGVQA